MGRGPRPTTGSWLRRSVWSGHRRRLPGSRTCDSGTVDGTECERGVATTAQAVSFWGCSSRAALLTRTGPRTVKVMTSTETG